MIFLKLFNESRTDYWQFSSNFILISSNLSVCDPLARPLLQNINNLMDSSDALFVSSKENRAGGLAGCIH